MLKPVTWIRKDFHVHEYHSKDAPGATPKRYCRIAEERGIDEICFTTHCIITGPDIDEGVSPNEIEDYMNEIFNVQDETDIKLRFGLELDYFPGYERQIEEVVNEYPFDFILGSLHYIRGIDIGSAKSSPSFFRGRSSQASLSIYYEDWGKAAETGLFDVMAHPDYFRRYLHLSEIKELTWGQYGSTIHDALDILKNNNVGLEINTSGYRHGIADVYPIKEFMQAAYDAGVKVVTIGSDSHTVDDLAINTIKAVGRLQEAGYEYTCVFKNRKARKIVLSDVRMTGEFLE